MFNINYLYHEDIGLMYENSVELTQSLLIQNDIERTLSRIRNRYTALRFIVQHN